MPFEIVRNDIVKMEVDAIVNTANPKPVVGTGVDTAIHKAAGPELLKAREAIGELKVCEAVATPAFDLPAKYVIHVVGPAWVDENPVEEEMLARSYRAALDVAAKQKCKSIAFPLLSTGNYGFPKKLSMRIALDVFSKFLMEHEMQIYLTVFGEEAFKLSNTLFRSVQSYIDENYVTSKFEEEYGVDEAAYHVGSANLSPRMKARRKEQQEYAAEYLAEAIEEDAADLGAPEILADATAEAPAPLAGKESLSDMMDKMDASFSDTLMALIDASGEKPSTIYTSAGVSKQVFSKINSNSDYQPSKATAIAFCLALKLDLEETQELLARAGFTLSKSSLSDVIIMYCIENEIYNVVFVNNILYEYDLTQIGSRKGES